MLPPLRYICVVLTELLWASSLLMAESHSRAVTCQLPLLGGAGSWGGPGSVGSGDSVAYQLFAPGCSAAVSDEKLQNAPIELARPTTNVRVAFESHIARQHPVTRAQSALLGAIRPSH